MEPKNKELEKANAELDRFVYSTSHDLRSPLLSILGLINLLENENENEKEKGKDYIRMIKKSITKQDEFISEILQYSRNARLEVTVEAFDLKDFVIDVVDDCRLLEGADSVKFIFDIQANRYIKTDKSRLSIILKNLITNSVKYRNMHNDSFVKIQTRIKDNVLCMELSDNGIGIAKSQHDLVFNMFHRATEKSAGSGLGLYIVSEMVKKLKGKIEMESEGGAGTRFSLFIPIKQNDIDSG